MQMNPLAQKENVRTLAAALGIDESDAAELLNISIAITFDPGNEAASRCADHIRRNLSRTIMDVRMNSTEHTHAFLTEVIIGECNPRFKTAHIFVSFGAEKLFVGSQPVTPTIGRVHPIGLVLASCYAVGFALKRATGNLLPFPSPEILSLDLEQILGDDLWLLYQPALFDEAYLAGAGAIGNGFIYALSSFEAQGKLHIVDDDLITGGNLQRCLLFEAQHIGRPKAEQLSAAANLLLPKVAATPHIMRLQSVPARGAGPWLKRLVVGVDSPRARRSLQTEIPREVFDASTTGISEVVMHFHRQPTAGACMSCIYHHSPQENAHEEHVASTLGVSVADVMQARVSKNAAERICGRYPQLDSAAVTGIAYDTLFKQLCSTAQLKKAEDRQVLTPFAFVSTLAGAWLAIEFVRRIGRGHGGLYNEWRISPWSNPIIRRQRHLARKSDCEFCSNPVNVSVTKKFWKD